MVDKSVLSVGKRLVELCNKGKNLDAVNTLYADDIVSIEPMGNEMMPARMEGIDAIRKKNEWFFNTHEIHSSTADGPWPNGNQFIVYFKIDVTAKEGPMKGQRMKLQEAGLYTVENDKVTREQFFCDLSSMPGMD